MGFGLEKKTQRGRSKILNDLMQLNFLVYNSAMTDKNVNYLIAIAKSDSDNAQ